mmetsp:Transcript_64884/g.154951  ORF Transcript_64884/g.154951 Transcript_64884/m.154951 type:complete len:324 (+) Transcript_64884:66-1037(+)
MAATSDAPSPPPTPSWPEIKSLLTQDELSPITARYRALMESRRTAPSTQEAVAVLSAALEVQTQSILLRHEIAYVLGQIGDKAATGILRTLAASTAEDEIVRHEAAEAVAAICAKDAIDELALYSEGIDTPSLLRDTCELAVHQLRASSSEDGSQKRVAVCACQYQTIDPAEGKDGATEEDVPSAVLSLCDASKPLVERYQAMFTLRNVGGVDAVAGLCQALRTDTKSACLRHEVAFVLGQMENDESVAALVESLCDPQEHAVVRHEAAIALGAVGTATSRAALEKFRNDPEPMVWESCVVALDILDYWEAWEALEARIAAER